jgi:hypothetical protein
MSCASRPRKGEGRRARLATIHFSLESILAISITCHGCGRVLAIPGDYKRRKVQCPECGVFLELPAPAFSKSRVPTEKRPRIPPADCPIPEANDAATELALDVWSEPHRAPQAISPPAAPAGQAMPPPASESLVPGPESEFVSSDADDGRPYRVLGDERKCQDCGKILPQNVTVCPQCGFNQETGKKAVRVYEPVALHWDAGLPLKRRLAIFIIVECIALALAVVGAALAGHLGESITSLFVFTVLLAFLLGTFDRVELTRSKRGRVMLTQTWRVLFIPRPTTTIPLREYEGVATKLAHDVGVLDWVILGVALLSGVIPGLIWWFWAMQQDTYEVALTKDHGYPERILYRGWSKDRAQQMAKTLHEVSGLPQEG